MRKLCFEGEWRAYGKGASESAAAQCRIQCGQALFGPMGGFLCFAVQHVAEGEHADGLPIFTQANKTLSRVEGYEGCLQNSPKLWCSAD